MEQDSDGQDGPLAVYLLGCRKFFCHAGELAHGDVIEVAGPTDDLQCLVFEGSGVEEGFAKLIGSIVSGEILFGHLLHKILPDFVVSNGCKGNGDADMQTSESVLSGQVNVVVGFALEQIGLPFPKSIWFSLLEELRKVE